MNVEKIYQGTADKVLRGIPASSGIVLGRAVVLRNEIFVDTHKTIQNEEIESEIKRFDIAKKNLVAEFEESISHIPPNAKDLKAILQADLMMVEDKFMYDSIIKFIKELHTAEAALVIVFDQSKQLLKHSTDELFRERVTELDNILKRFIIHLSKGEKLSEISENTIIIAQSLTPSELLKLIEKKVTAIVTEVGGITSHLAILTRSYSIPAIISLKNATHEISANDEIILDGYTGHLFINPDLTLYKFYREKQKRIAEHIKELGELIGLPCKTKDEKPIQLWCNANNIDDVKNAKIVSSPGLGLVRTESLILSLNRIPTEKEQYDYYKTIADTAYPMTVTLRAFDIGSDKYADNLLIHEDNPALGLRGIRYLLAKKDEFKIQLRAILKASKHKNIRLMLPMITSLEEVIQTKKLLEECKLELLNEDETFDHDMLVGIMIETPAAALIADDLSKICDFFSLGTNDLTQYCLAADRTNESLSEFFNSFHPGVLRLMEFTVNAAHKNNIPVAVCGEMASHPLATSFLIGMGVDELSVAPSLFLEVKEKILDSSFKQCQKNVSKILKTAMLKDIYQSMDV
ncbi:MAG: phosphoenolpyruvate--protein phosphotransferase [Ignavibacteria bacterium GWF2_33_9]|nr:MAG: phosphoenolpyruvate--protein phosphotransferase [Ignavibacteria bacterium GWF2_33_9]